MYKLKQFIILILFYTSSVLSQNNEIKILDGGTGAEIRRRGYEVPYHVDSIWSAQSLIDNPEVVEQIHYDYIHAGAKYITINNYALFIYSF